MTWLNLWCVFFRCWFRDRGALALENLALRQQLAVFERCRPRPRLAPRDRLFWVLLSRLWGGWQSALAVVSPATVVRWHRQGFQYYWRWKSRGRPGRPRIAADLRRLIRQLSRDNPLWGAPRLQAELHLLGHDLAVATVAKYMDRRGKPPSPTWRSFLHNHLTSLASMDFFVVPTVTFRVLYVFVVMRHERRQVVHVGVTERPSAAWVTQQLRKAFPFDSAPAYLVHDRDGAYGQEVRQALANMGIEEVLTAPRSPWQNPFVERLIGSIRRECLDHCLVLNELHLKRLLTGYLTYYHHARPHRSLDQNAPHPRAIEPPNRGRIVAEPMVGGQHHRYRRVA